MGILGSGGRGSVVALALAALAASGEAGERASGDVLVLVDLAGVPPFAVEVLVAEATAILEPVVGPPEWRVEAPGGGYGPGEIPVMLLSRGPATERRLVLGSVQRSAPRPAAWVFVESVLCALDLDGSTEALSPHEARHLGLALGRVAAHEIVHALAPEEEHATFGLMARSLHPAELSGPRPALDGASARRLRAGVDAWRARRAARSRRGPLRAGAAQASEARPR